ncbi:MAG: stage II sporulation protein M, partial [Longimicrobiales bacterium]
LIVLHPRAQRLGDMAAGTIVVQETRAVSLPEEEGLAGPPRMTDPEFEILRQYALRREGLEREARTRVAAKLVSHFAPYAADLPKALLLRPDKASHADMLLSIVHADESARRSAAGGRSGSGTPAAAALLRRQRPRWAMYDALLERARSARLSSLSHEELSRFAALYREVAADLARARTYGASPEMLYTLERAVGAGHNVLYSPPARSARLAWEWLATGFPALVRRHSLAVALAGLLLYGPALASFIAVAAVPARAPLIVPAGMIARAEEGAARYERGQGYVEVPEVFMPLFSSGIIANNVQVTFFAFAGGIVVGLGTIAILLMNGVMLGGVAGLFHAQGLSPYLWSFVLPHGIIELTAICIAGGAGLLLGSGIVLPGRRTRRSALVRRARDAVSLLGGTVAMLVLAGLIEGFISPAPLPAAVKLGFGVLTAVVLSLYLLLGGRGAGPEPPPGAIAGPGA